MAQKYIFNLIKLLMVLLWPVAVATATTIAATVDPFVGITTLHILVMLIISTLSGLTALTIRIDSELKKQGLEKLPRPRLFVSSHMLGCWLAGVLAVALSQLNNFTIWSQITLVIAASFTGAKFVEKISEIYIGKVTGVPPKPAEEPTPEGAGK